MATVCGTRSDRGEREAFDSLPAARVAVLRPTGPVPQSHLDDVAGGESGEVTLRGGARDAGALADLCRGGFTVSERRQDQLLRRRTRAGSCVDAAMEDRA